MDALGIETKLLLGQIVNFLILFLILTKFLYKPLLKMLDERRQKIAQSLENVQKIETDLANTEKKISEMLLESEKKSAKMIEEAVKAGNLQKEEIITLAQDQSAQEIAKAKIAITAEKNQAAKELEKEIINLVGLATEKIIKQKVSSQMQEAAIKEATNEYGEKK